MKKQIKQRLPEISKMNILFCLMVIFIHVSSAPVTQYPIGTWKNLAIRIPWHIAGMAVYGFIFLSGLKLFLPSKKEFHLGKFYWNRIRSILFPYLLWSAIYYFVPALQSGSFSWSGFLNSLYTGSASYHLYFIILILQFYLLIPLWRRCVQKIHPAIALPIALVFTNLFWLHLPELLGAAKMPGFLYNDRVFLTYLFFWLAGCYVGANYERFKSSILAHPWAVSIFFLFSASLDIAVVCTNLSGKLYLPIQNESRILFLISGILFVFMLSARFADRMTNGFISLLDHSSFYIYLAHIFVLEHVAKVLTRHWGIQSIFLSFLINALITFGLTIPLCMGYTALKKKILKKRG